MIVVTIDIKTNAENTVVVKIPNPNPIAVTINAISLLGIRDIPIIKASLSLNLETTPAINPLII